MAAIHQVFLSKCGARVDCAEDETILIAALKAGHPLAYECASGSCGTCFASLDEGSVEMRWPGATGLSARQRERGRILLCQAQPRSDCTVGEQISKHSAGSVPRPQTVEGRILTIGALSHDTARVVIEPERPIAFLPGQYALVDLLGGKGMRAYSMSNFAEKEGGPLEFFIRKVEGGRVSRKLIDPVLVGGKVLLHAPLGLAYLRPEVTENVLCIAGGSGLAPMLSIARGLAAGGHLGRRRVDMLFGARTHADFFAVDQIETIRRTAPEFFSVIYAVSHASARHMAPDGSRLETGFLHEVLERLWQDYAGWRVYMAGPPPMIDALLRLLLQKKIPLSHIHYDRFA